MGVDGEVTLNMRTKTKLGEEPEFIFCNDDSIKTNQGMRRPARARRGRPTEEEKQNKKKVKEVGGPCLRCRILKKRVWPHRAIPCDGDTKFVSAMKETRVITVLSKIRTPKAITGRCLDASETDWQSL